MGLQNKLRDLSLLLKLLPNSNWESNMPKQALKELKNEEIIQGIRTGSPEVINYLKVKAYPFVKKYVIMNNGAPNDADIVFQDALVVIFRKVKGPGLHLNCQFTTYFNAVCKYIWRYELQKGNNPLLVSVDEINNFFDENELEGLYRESKEFQLYRHYFKKLKKRQQKILNAAMSEKKYSELYGLFGYKSVDAFKNEVSRIKKLLIKQISSDPRFKKYSGKPNWSL